MKDDDYNPPIEFDYDYFDNPRGLGYQGYSHEADGDQFVYSWKEIARYCVNKGIDSAIDIGCAKGFLVEALLDYGINAKGYDVSSYALSFASNLPCYRRSVIEGIPHKADAIFCLGVLLYLKSSDIPIVLKIIRESCKSWFFFSSYYSGDPQRIPDPLRQIDQTREWWRKQIENSGFLFDTQEDYFDVYK